MEFDDSLSASMDDFAENTQDIDIPEELPMMAVRDVVVFNYMILPLFVGRPGSVSAVNEAMEGDKLLMLVTQKDATSDEPDPDDLYTIGMVSMIMRTLKLPDGRLKVLVQALSKAEIESYEQKDPHFRVKVALVEEESTEKITVEVEALMRLV
ncbi:MAG: endopeptidase La, partial [Candidatus Electrothrix sp. EH2]|nr:endopeptidase La [Candidatus Electrothrix sp. EH2]